MILILSLLISISLTSIKHSYADRSLDLSRIQAILESSTIEDLDSELNSIHDLEVYRSVCQYQLNQNKVPWSCYKLKKISQRYGDRPEPTLSKFSLSQSCERAVENLTSEEDLPTLSQVDYLDAGCLKKLNNKRQLIYYKLGREMRR